MPILTIQGPRIADPQAKRVYVEELTQAATKAYGMPAEKIILIFQDTAPEDVAVAGQLIADR